ncbi:melatonin receptor type 1C-like [Montipora foliosa]|uniref:melatonin receptor type 1C-like n=1 Tax=Montipora foliosa TaxID=591990 RepID=UPI0035F16454
MTFTDETSRRSVLSTAIESTLFVIINVIAIVGNSFVIAAVLRNPTLRKMANWYMLTLALADLLVAVTCMPLTLGAAIKGQWLYSDVTCQIQGHVIQIWACFSLTTVAATAVHRYYRVIRPVRYREIFTKVFTISMVVSCLVLSTVVPVGMVLYLDARFQFGPHFFCTPNFHTQKSKPIALTMFLGCIIIPSTILLFCYFKVYRAVRRHVILVVRNLRAQKHTHRSSEIKLSCRVEEINTTKLVFAIITVFCVLWIPMCIIGALFVCGVFLPRWGHMIFDYLMFTTTATNPLIYGLMNKAFRAEYARIIGCKRRRSATDHIGKASVRQA